MRAHSLVSVLVVLAASAFLCACAPEPLESAFFERGSPESLIDVSSEVVNLGVGSAREREELAQWIEKDQPTRAELYCAQGDPRCVDAQKVLDLSGVPTMLVPSSSFNVTLVYERILARDCNPRFVDNTGNDYNTNHAAFGCAIAANIVQHVSDKQQFVSPNLSDNPSARRSVTDWNRAYTPRPAVTPYNIDNTAFNGLRQQ